MIPCLRLHIRRDTRPLAFVSHLITEIEVGRRARETGKERRIEDVLDYYTRACHHADTAFVR